MCAADTSDVLVIGGGVVGLSIAYELARDGLSVTILERGVPGREASWAGAGVLPPASWYVDDPDLDALCLAASAQHAEWSQRLYDQTGIDDEYWACGAEYRRTADNASHVDAAMRRWASLGVEVSSSGVVPGEAQVRNPRRLRALVAGCVASGVAIESHTEVGCVDAAVDGSIRGIDAGQRRYSAGLYVFAAGCWTPRLAEAAGSMAPGRPVRGQIILLKPSRPVLDRVVHLYPYYAVPRRDGRVLVGATVEETGFVKQTTEEARRELLAAAEAIDPKLTSVEIEAHWSGLRPASADRLPLIGRLPGVCNALVASGHHRSGLQLAPPTAEIVRAIIRGAPSPYPIERFDPARFGRRCVVA